MGEKSKIEWTETTWNPIRGCSSVSEGCRYCYAAAMASRFSGPGQPYEGLTKDGRWTGTVRMVPEHLGAPLRWKRPRRVFVNSMSDVFHEALAFEDVAEIFRVMAAAPQHSFQVLTKRAERMAEWFRWMEERKPGVWPLPNVWLGISVENQAAADLRVPFLLQSPAAVRWLSCEPLLGPVDLSGFGALDWVVVGGESGLHARPMHPDWVRGVRDYCAQAKVPFLFKQYGEWAPAMGDLYWRPLDGGPQFPVWASGTTTHAFGDGYGAVRIGKAKAGRLLDGCVHDSYPVEAAGLPLFGA